MKLLCSHFEFNKCIFVDNKIVGSPLDALKYLASAVKIKVIKIIRIHTTKSLILSVCYKYHNCP